MTFQRPCHFMKTIILDPGHGLSNKTPGVFDPGVCFEGVRECDVARDWVNELRAILRARGHGVIRTRAHDDDPAPVVRRAAIAKAYGGDIMISIHVNSTPGASGTETFYRGEANRALATDINAVVAAVLGTKNRGAKTETQSQHTRLAIMSFQPCFLIELGFIESDHDLAAMLDPYLRRKACEAIAALIA